MRFTTSAIIFSALILSLHAFAKDKPKVTFKANSVGEGLYMLSGEGGFAGGNIGLWVGEDGVLMIDNAMPPMLDILKKAIAELTSEPLDFLINTHVHGDHIGNNQAFAESGARIIAHKNLRKRMLKQGVQTSTGMEKAPKTSLPVIGFSKSMSFHLNGQDAEVIHLPKAHTDGDSVIYFKRSNVIHAGDIFFHKMFPFIDLKNGGSVAGYIVAQKRIYALSDDKTKIIPGHGSLATKASLAQDIKMLEESSSLVNKLIRKGKSEDDIVKANPLAKYHDVYNWGFITTEKMTRQIYKSLTASEPSSVTHDHSYTDH